MYKYTHIYLFFLFCKLYDVLKCIVCMLVVNQLRAQLSIPFTVHKANLIIIGLNLKKNKPAKNNLKL